MPYISLWCFCSSGRRIWVPSWERLFFLLKEKRQFAGHNINPWHTWESISPNPTLAMKVSKPILCFFSLLQKNRADRVYANTFALICICDTPENYNSQDDHCDGPIGQFLQSQGYGIFAHNICTAAVLLYYCIIFYTLALCSWQLAY